MNRTDRFDEFVSDWLHADAEHRVPEHLDAVLRRTSTERQRPAWSSLERWLPMDTATTLRGRATAPRPLLVFAVLVALLLAAMGVVVYTGALRSQTPAFGLATNGRILVADGTTIRTFGADGTGGAVVLELPRTAGDLVMSPDGTRVAAVVQTGPPSIQIVRLGQSGAVTLPTLPGAIDIASAVSWSPDGKRVTFLVWKGSREHLVVAEADGSRTTELAPLTGIDPALGLWSPVWSPDGSSIAFIAGNRESETGGIHLIRPDGTGLQDTTVIGMSARGGVSWSPDPSVRRLLYRRFAGVNNVHVYDFATAKESIIRDAFWPVWSPDGTKISTWTKVIPTAEVLAGTGRFTPIGETWADGGSCKDHQAELAGKSFCGPASWSPDGKRLIAPDITGTSILSVLADGTGGSFTIPLQKTDPSVESSVTWQPIRP